MLLTKLRPNTHNLIIIYCVTDELLDALSKIVQWEMFLTPIYVQYDNCCQEFWNIVSGLDIQLEQT